MVKKGIELLQIAIDVQHFANKEKTMMKTRLNALKNLKLNKSKFNSGTSVIYITLIS